MKFGSSFLGDYNLGTNREYLLSNGIGSFSSACINGNNSRRYHGLLTLSTLPPLDRVLLFHKIEEEIDGESLVCKKVFGKISDGHKKLESFELNPFPKYRYSFNGNIFEKEIFMNYGKNRVTISYKLIDSVKESVEAKFRMFFNYRDSHSMSELEKDFKFEINKDSKKLTIKNEEKKIEAYLYSNKIDDFVEEAKTLEGIEYEIEIERGDDSVDNSFQIGYLSSSMKKGETIYIVMSMEKEEINVDRFRDEEIERRNKLKEKVNSEDTFLKDLAVAADDFIVERKSTNGKTILAGYPWFGDWGRDTMIALPGLTLSTGRYEDARSIFLTFVKYCSEGMLPNKFPDWEGEELMYNTIDASLWFFYAVDEYVKASGDYDFIKKEVYPALKEILDYHVKGTRYKIKLDEKDGLLSGGDYKTQLTWMDVKYEGWAVTPRYGKAVEINALWYNALKVMENFSEKFNDDFSGYNKYIELIEKNYINTFWNEKNQSLYDYITEGEISDDIRPNQIFAVSLPYSLLNEEQSKKVVNMVYEKLYTVNGLRSLDKENDKYIGIYKGTLFQRDASYHQGTVWSWPLGHFLSAHYKVYNDKEKIKLLSDGLKNHFYQEACINNVSEVFDGDSPNYGRGCFAQAWSVGELLRVLKEID